MEVENILRTIYYDPKNPSGYSTEEKLYKAAKEHKKDLTRKQVHEWFIGEFTPTLHKQVVRKFERNPIVVENIDQQWEADLVDMQEFAKSNKNYKYILNVIDVLSKFAWSIPLKNKKGETIAKSFEIIFKKGRMPVFLRTDQGKEFLNKNFKTFLKEMNVHHFTSKNHDIKCAIVERFNRTMKGRMFKFFTANGTRNWIKHLDDFIDAYNNSYHRTIKRTPLQASESKNEDLFKCVYGVDTIDDLKNNLNNKMNVDDSVRIVYDKKPFDKSFYPNWTDKIEKIDKISSGIKEPMLTIENEKQRYYPQQLQKVKENLFRVEKILRSKMRNNKKWYYVKWLNYPDTYNGWVKEEDITNLNDDNQ